MSARRLMQMADSDYHLDTFQLTGNGHINAKVRVRLRIAFTDGTGQAAEAELSRSAVCRMW